ncbi:MAG: Clp protease ClpP [Marinoscillum sp.]|uniref:Clp protease ClpP n=1 Tax=Marinoscillum sp. TaxID=2024838 RepID=UPI0032FB1AD1
MKRFELKALSDNSAEIYLYGTFGVEILASEVVQKIVEAAGKYQNILLRIHSRGGDPLDGLGILQAIKDAREKVTVNTRCDGIAASFASVIFACGTRREIAQFGRVMIHQASGSSYGQVEELKQMAALMETINDDMASVYAEASGKEKKWVLKNWMQSGKDTWFRADEAKTAGLATDIVEGIVKDTTESDPIKLVAFFDEALFNSNQYDMKLSMYIPGLNKVPGIKLGVDASETEIHAAMDQALTKTVAIAAELETKTAELNTKNAEIAALKTSTLKEKAEVMVEAQVGVRITAEEKGYFITMASKDDEAFEATKKQLGGMPVIQDPMAIIAQGKTNLSGRKDANGKALIELGYKELFKDHGKFLAQLRAEQPEVAAQKYEDAYGSKPSWATA